MTDDFKAMIYGTYALHRLALDSLDDGPEADAIRDAMNAPWGRLGEQEREAAGQFSEWLHLCEEAESNPPPITAQQAKPTDNPEKRGG